MILISSETYFENLFEELLCIIKKVIDLVLLDALHTHKHTLFCFKALKMAITDFMCTRERINPVFVNLFVFSF